MNQTAIVMINTTQFLMEYENFCKKLPKNSGDYQTFDVFSNCFQILNDFQLLGLFFQATDLQTKKNELDSFIDKIQLRLENLKHTNNNSYWSKKK